MRTLFLAAAFVLLAGPMGGPSNPTPPAWEYQIVNNLVPKTRKQVEAQFNELAAEGWEYVGPLESGRKWSGFVFRRPKN